MTKTLYRRVRRKFMGGRMEVRIYTDGSMRVHVDHPSNDPEIEMAMAGRIYGWARQKFAEEGLPPPVIGPVRWNDDP